MYVMDTGRLCSWFLALENDTHFLYKTTDYYSKESERAIFGTIRTWQLTGLLIQTLMLAKDQEACSFAHIMQEQT